MEDDVVAQILHVAVSDMFEFASEFPWPERISHDRSRAVCRTIDPVRRGLVRVA